MDEKTYSERYIEENDGVKDYVIRCKEVSYGCY